jgi:hypothetical protein
MSDVAMTDVARFVLCLCSFRRKSPRVNVKKVGPAGLQLQRQASGECPVARENVCVVL